MKAIRVRKFGGPDLLTLEEVSPLTPAAGQVCVAVKAAGVNPVDTYWRAGANPNLPLPFTPGLDGAGVVESVGEGVADVRVGDRVYFGGWLSGSYSEQALLRARQVHPLPSSISFEQGAALHVPYATAHRALFHRAQAKAGETILIHGASGGVGLAAIQFAAAAGMTVIGTAGTARGRDLVLSQGAKHVLDHTKLTYLSEIPTLTDGRGVDVILEMLANVNLAKDLPLLARNGRVIVIGNRGSIEITPRDLMLREADVRGMSLFNTSDEELVAIHQAIVSGLKVGTLRPVIGKTFGLSEARHAHEAVMEPGAYGKILLIP